METYLVEIVRRTSRGAGQLDEALDNVKRERGAK